MDQGHEGWHESSGGPLSTSSSNTHSLLYHRRRRQYGFFNLTFPQVLSLYDHLLFFLYNNISNWSCCWFSRVYSSRDTVSLSVSSPYMNPHLNWGEKLWIVGTKRDWNQDQPAGLLHNLRPVIATDLAKGLIAVHDWKVHYLGVSQQKRTIRWKEQNICVKMSTLISLLGKICKLLD